MVHSESERQDVVVELAEQTLKCGPVLRGWLGRRCSISSRVARTIGLASGSVIRSTSMSTTA
jgi:hypothetical protein